MGLCIVEMDGDTILMRKAVIQSVEISQMVANTETVGITATSRGRVLPCTIIERVTDYMVTNSSEKEHIVVGKDELIHQIAAKAGLNLKETGKVIDAFTEVVRESVAQGHEVRLMGFGTWNLREVASRRVKSIRGGTQITIPARKRVGFSVGAVLSKAAQGTKDLSTLMMVKASASEANHARNSQKSREL